MATQETLLGIFTHTHYPLTKFWIPAMLTKKISNLLFTYLIICLLFNKLSKWGEIQSLRSCGFQLGDKSPGDIIKI